MNTVIPAENRDSAVGAEAALIWANLERTVSGPPNTGRQDRPSYPPDIRYSLE